MGNVKVKLKSVDIHTTKYILCSMNTVISIKIDKNLKSEAQEVVKSAGLTLSSVVNSYLRQLVATRRIEIYSPEQMTPKLETLISEVEGEVKTGNVSKKFTDPQDFLTDLKS